MSASSTASTSTDDLSSESASQMSEAPLLPEESILPQNPNRRKPRTTVTQWHVSTLIELVNAEEKPDLKRIALSIGLSIATVYRLLRKIKDGDIVRDNRVVLPATVKGRKRVCNSRKVEIVREVMTSDRAMTLERGQAELHQMGIDMSTSTLWRVTTKQLHLSHKKISTKPAVVFDEQVTEQRFDYAQRVNELPDQELWFLDESGFNLHIAPLRCWAPKGGRPPVLAVPTNRGVNVSLLMCISPDGIVNYQIKRGSFKAADFVEYLQALADHFPAVRNGEVCLVMDNARIHHARAATAFLNDNNIHHIFLPPYSPELNPIELVFGVLKRRYRKRGVAHSQGQMKRRIKNIIDQMNEDLDVQTFYDHARRFVRMAMNRELFN